MEHPTAEEVLTGKNLSQKRVMITGSSGGIGIETARRMAGAGAKIVMANRKSDKSKNAANLLREEGTDIEELDLDLGSLKNIKHCVKEYKDRFDSLDILINNAGVMACPQTYTDDGFEMQFGVNHIGHFYLTCGLAPLLAASDAGRVVNLSSAGHRRGSVDFEDPNYKNRPYDKWDAYGQSKTANMLFSVELNRRLEPYGVLAFSVHPGMIATDLARHLVKEDLEMFASRDKALEDAGQPSLKFKATEQGAATTVWAATAEELESAGGSYLEDCHIGVPNKGPTDLFGYSDYALDPENARKLWQLSEELVGEKFDLEF